MKIVIITQDNPLYIAESIETLIKKLRSTNEIVGCIVADPSPFGKKESFKDKALNTYRIFGVNFFIYYSIKYIFNKFLKRKSLTKILFNNSIKNISLNYSVNHPDSINEIKKLKPDLMISLAGNEIFKKEFINIPPKGCLNLHTALLPKYRGLMPTFWALKNDEEYTGVSVFFVDEGIDSGDIIIQKRLKIGAKTQAQLIKETKKLGVDAIVEAVNAINKNNVNIIKNDDKNMTYFSFPTKKDVREFKKKKKKFF